MNKLFGDLHKEKICEHVKQLLDWNEEILHPHLETTEIGKKQKEILKKIYLDTKPKIIKDKEVKELEAVVLDRGRPVLFINNNTFDG